MPKGYPYKTKEEKDAGLRRRRLYSKNYTKLWRKRNPEYHKKYWAIYAI